jgi:phosphate starvation-inducible PhoH-like protein
MARKRTKFDDSRPTLHIEPKTEKQKEYLAALRSHSQVIVLGPAGTGKTYVAASFAASLYLSKHINRVILTRPNIAASKSLGFFPGTLHEKMSPWMIPVVDVLTKHLGSGVVDTAIKNGNIEYAPFETMRGRSFEDSFVILDEAQNTTPKEMMMFLTRVGENCRVVLNGDLMQRDVHDQSGLWTAINLSRKHSIPVPVIEFALDDIVRSDLCRMWVEAFIKEGIN